MPSKLDKAGELGLLGISIPEQYGGFEKDFNTSLLINEATGAGHSFAVALSAHTGIGTLPIVYYGNDEQKTKYLPDLTTGVKKSLLLFNGAWIWIGCKLWKNKSRSIG
jgi:alkylation response protein AidB-like acyl-CoA dehydrogenase